MIRTFISILITLALLVGVSVFELHYVNASFNEFSEVLYTLREKVDASLATYDDGKIVQDYWEDQKKSMHVWIPHASLQEIDLQLDEAVAYLYEGNFAEALPKVDVAIRLAEDIPKSYEWSFGNVF